jgi:O-antigen/teichoic acid export membrane protein
MSVLAFISSVSSFGLPTSAVKEIAKANNKQDSHDVNIITIVVNKWLLFTGVLGSLLMLIFAMQLSLYLFGTSNYQLAFVALSIAVFFTSIANAKNAILQGLQKIKQLANAKILGAFTSLFVTVLLIFLFKEKGVIPSIILSTITTYIITYYYVSKLPYKHINLNLKKIYLLGRSMASFGIVLSFNGILSTGISFLIIAYITKSGGLGDVGYYQAGWTIINGYVGMIFSAMLIDYYPRLSKIAKDVNLLIQNINEQIEMVLFIITPILLLLMLNIKQIVILLYSSDFVIVNEMVAYSLLGILFKGVSWSIGVSIISTSNKRIYLMSEITANIVVLFTTILSYKYMGIKGIGISITISYFFHMCLVYFLTRKAYGFKLINGNIKYIIISVILVLTALLINLYINTDIKYILITILLVMSSIFSYIELDIRLNIKSMIIKYFNK